jgi:hypothetical protein
MPKHSLSNSRTAFGFSAAPISRRRSSRCGSVGILTRPKVTRKNAHIAGVLIAWCILMCMPSIARAEDFRNVAVFLGLGSLVSVALAVVCSLWIYKKTSSVFSWLLFPLWTILAFGSICLVCILAIKLYEYIAA